MGFVFSCDLPSYLLFLSAAISEEITEMESQHEALYGRNTESEPGRLSLLNYAIRCFNRDPPFHFFHLHKFLGAGSGWVSALSLNLLPAYQSLMRNCSK